MSEQHARLGPSNHRWPHCPGSIREEERYPDIAGDAAVDGTGSHFLLECCLTHNVRASAYEGQVIGVNHPDKPEGWMVNQDRIERVQQCLDYIERRVQELRALHPNAEVHVYTETKANPGIQFGRDDWWGTVDVTIEVSANGQVFELETVDYKDGREFVSPKNNTQLISYGYGKLPTDKKWFVGKKIVMTIVQPKTNPVVRSWDVTLDEMLDLAADLADRANATDDPDAPLVSGDHCRWCKANPKRGGHCTAESQKAMELIPTIPLEGGQGSSLFELVNETFGDITTLDTQKLIELADAEAGILAVFDRVRTEMVRRIESGQSVPGYAMQPGRGSNVWSGTEEEVVKMLKAKRVKQSDIYPAKLISPAQALKLNLTDKQKEDIKKNHITHMAGNLTLTKVREKEQPKAEEMFAEVVQQQAAPVSFM